MPKRAALYIRVSSDEQARHGLSLGEQRADLLNYAKEHGYIVMGIYADEGVTARKALSRRKELQRLLADVEQGLVDIISTTETTMTQGTDGEYVAGAAGQTILQTVNVASLINDYGADTDIKGIAVIGNPAYRTAEGLSELTALQHDGTALTEYGTKLAPTSSSGMVMDGHALSMKLPALANYKFGWKAGVGS